MKRENLALVVAALALVVALGHGHPWADAGVSFSGVGDDVGTLNETISWTANQTPEMTGPGGAALNIRPGSAQSTILEDGTGTARLTVGSSNVDFGASPRFFSTIGVLWSSAIGDYNSLDAGLARSAASVVDVTDSGSGPGAFGLRNDGALPVAQSAKALLAAESIGSRSRVVVIPDVGANNYPGGRLTTNAAAVGTGAATAEADLQTYSLTAATMGSVASLRITASGTTAGTADAKTIRLYFGATSLGSISIAAAATSDWIFRATVTNDAATGAQVIEALGMEGGTALTLDVVDFLTAAIDTTAAVTIKTTGTTPNSADEVTSEILIVELIP